MDAKNKNFKTRPVAPRSSDENMIFGLRPIIEALEAGRDLEKVFVQKNLKGDLSKELWTALKPTLTPVSKVPIEKLNRFTRKNHQGVVAFVSPVKYHTIENLVQNLYESGRSPCILALDSITDVRNFGAIARTAECMGVDGLVIPTQGGVQINGDAVKTSAGALNYIPVCRTENLEASISYLKNSGLSVVGCTEKSKEAIDKVDLKGPVALVLGSEEIGISPAIIDLCDAKARIPLFGKIESLNVSVAASIMMYEVNRQRS